MKAVFATIVTMMMSVSAFAVHQNSSWSEIFSDRDAVVTHGYSFNGIALDNACVTATEVRAIRPTRECVSLVPVQRGNPNSEAGGFTDWVCERWATVSKVAPRSYEKNVCEEFDGNGERYPECKSYGTETVYIPQTISTQVTITRGEGDVSFFKYYTLPTCERPQPR